MNKAQQAVAAKFDRLLEDIAEPLDEMERGLLRTQLAHVKHDSIWGTAIAMVFVAPTPEKVDQLIEQLAGQALDDVFTMTCVVGQNIVKLLLRSTL